MIKTNYKNDISGLQNIKKLYESSMIKKWIKLISTDKTTSFEQYSIKKKFIHVADIVLDNEKYISGKKQGQKKRNTLIRFIPTISTEKFIQKNEWLYLFVINGMIVKIGGTRVSLKERTASYLCGHHIKEREKSGDCSKTNAFIYNTFVFYLNLDCKIQMYAYKLPKTETITEILGKKITIEVQTYHAYESIFLENYKKKYKSYPILNWNCDPNYKK